MSKRIALVMVIACFVAVVGGVIAFVSLQSDDDSLLQSTTITLSGDTQKTYRAELSGLYPDGQKSYEININGDNASSLQISLTFRDNDNGKLIDFVNVQIKAGEQTITKTLKELLDGKQTIALGANISKIEITYSMPEDAGNEAQGTSVSFYLDITAKRSAE